MPRFALQICCLTLLVGLCAAYPSYGLFPRPEPDEWPTLQFRIFDPNNRQIVYRTANGEDFRDGETLVREKPGQVTTLKSPVAVDIRGYTLAGIQYWPITPETETVLLIDQLYNPDLPYGGITEKSRIIREKPRGGWAQRFLSGVEHRNIQLQMWRTRKPLYEVEAVMPPTQFPTLHLTLEPYEFTLPPGKHTIQVLMLDAAGKPMNPPITSRYATVLVLPSDINYWPIALALAGLSALVALAVAIMRYHRGRSLGRRS